MKINEMMKRTGLKLAAIIVIGGVLMFTFTGCNKPAEEVTETVAVETVVEMEETGAAVAGGLYAEEATIEDGQEAEVAEEYTIDFVDCNNEDIVAEQGDMVILPEYERPLIKNIIGEVFDSFDESDTDNYTILEETENKDGTTTYKVALASTDLSLGCTTQYSVDKETGKAKALFVYMPVNYEDMTAEDFGLHFEINVDEEGKAELIKIYDLIGNDVSDIPYYSGDAIGYSMTKAAVSVDFEFGDEVSVSQDLTLYPVFDGGDNPSNIDTSEGFWVIGYTGVPVQVGTSYEASDLEFMVVDGEIISTDGTKQVDIETGEVKEAENGTQNGSTSGSEKGNNETEKGSVAGGAGHTPVGENNNANAGSGSGEPAGMSPDEIAAKFGKKYGGDGSQNPSSGYDGPPLF